MPSFVKPFLLFGILLAAGCSTVPSTQHPQQPSQQSPQSGPQSQTSDKAPAAEPASPPSAPVAVREVARKEPEPEAVAYLLDQSQSELNRARYVQAQVLAERALRIDRKAARAYLLLAKIHKASGDLVRAKQFARQGLLYVDSGSSVGRALKQILKGR